MFRLGNLVKRAAQVITPAPKPLPKPKWQSRWAVSEMDAKFEARAVYAAAEVTRALKQPVTLPDVIRSLQMQGASVRTKNDQQKLTPNQVAAAAREAALFNFAVDNAHETRAIAEDKSLSQEVFGTLKALEDWRTRVTPPPYIAKLGLFQESWIVVTELHPALRGKTGGF